MIGTSILTHVLNEHSIIGYCDKVIDKIYQTLVSVQEIYGPKVHEWMLTKIIVFPKIQEITHNLEQNWNNIRHEDPDRQYPAVTRQRIIETLRHLTDIKTSQYNKVGHLSMLPDFEWQIQDTINSAEHAVRWLVWDLTEIHMHFYGALAQLHHVVMIKNFHVALKRFLITHLPQVDVYLLPEDISNTM